MLVVDCIDCVVVVRLVLVLESVVIKGFFGLDSDCVSLCVVISVELRLLVILGKWCMVGFVCCVSVLYVFMVFWNDCSDVVICWWCLLLNMIDSEFSV